MGRVIRGTRKETLPGDLAQAQREADRLVQTARAHSVRLVQDAEEAVRTLAERAAREAEVRVSTARSEAAAIRRAAHEQGLADAHREATAMLLEASRVRARALEGVERDARALAIAAAERILGDELSLAPARIDTLVRAAIGRARRARALVVRVHPDDLPQVRVPEDTPVELVPDATLARGDCIVESELGHVDARISTQLATLADLLECASRP